MISGQFSSKPEYKSPRNPIIVPAVVLIPGPSMRNTTRLGPGPEEQEARAGGTGQSICTVCLTKSGSDHPTVSLRPTCPGGSGKDLSLSGPRLGDRRVWTRRRGRGHWHDDEDDDDDDDRIQFQRGAPMQCD
eukprot:929491-Rhodomonas_salina.1